MLEARAQPRPEAAARHYLVVGGTPVVVRPHRAACRQVALSHHQRGDKERIVVVLFVGGEDNVVAHLATRYGRVVAHHRVVQAHPELQVHMLAQHKAFGDAAVFARAAVAHHPVGQHDAVLYAGRCLLIGEDGHIVYRMGVLNHAVAPHAAVAAFAGGQTLARYLLQTVHHLTVVAVLGPQVCVADGHAAKGQYLAASVLVHGL